MPAPAPQILSRSGDSLKASWLGPQALILQRFWFIQVVFRGEQAATFSKSAYPASSRTSTGPFLCVCLLYRDGHLTCRVLAP